MGTFSSFVLLAGMRTGSNYLEANLNAMPGIVCLGEMFNPHFFGKKDHTEALGLDLAARDRDPVAVLDRMRAAHAGLVGFRLFHDHDRRVLAAVLEDRACAKIVLTRNPLDSYVSWKIAQETGQWLLKNPRNLKTAQVRFDGEEFVAMVEMQQTFQLEILHALQTSGQTAFYLDYEDISDIDVLAGLARFLGVDAAPEAPDATLKKQNPDEIESKVSNPGDIPAALRRLDRFNLGRTPNFEPRRGPAVPTMVLARGAPFLFLPIRGAAEAPVTSWLAALGGAGTETGLSQKDLRHWKKLHPGHRSFTVLRHPLLRAHVAFRTRILSDQAAEVRRALKRQFGIDLPPSDKALTPDEHRAAFLAFLRFVKMNLAGQTALRVDAHWASQAATIQGFAQFIPPDLILREDEAPEALARLAARFGVTAPAWTTDETNGALATIMGPEIEKAAQDALQRDYVTFGFGPWSPSQAA